MRLCRSGIGDAPIAIGPIMSAMLAVSAMSAMSVASVALAQQLEPARGMIELAAEASREVQNDTMNAVLFTEATDPNPAQLATVLNRTLNEAFKISQESPAIKATSGGTQTYPVYDRTSGNRITGWRGRAELRLEGKDFREIGALVGKLQSTMRLAGIGFSVSPELRRASENELITEAIGAFRARAEIARAALGARAFRIRHMQIGTSGAVPRPPRPLGMEMRAEVSAASVPAPQFEGGASQIQVIVNGSVDTE